MVVSPSKMGCVTMRTITKFIGAAATLALATSPALAADKGSSGRQAQAKKQMEIPRCTRKLGSVAIVEPDNQCGVN